MNGPSEMVKDPSRPIRPHADRTKFTREDNVAIAAYLKRDGHTNSFFGREAELAEYEGLLSEYFGRRYCILMNSGTSALYSAYFALGLGPGDEVIVPTYTHHATVMPLVHLGCAVRFADCCPDTGNIDPTNVQQLIGPDTRAIVVTHQWGHPAEGHRLRVLANDNKLFLVEDVSLAVCSDINGKLAGTFGDAACFSLGSSKMFSGGQGGAVLFDKPAFYERATLLGHFGPRSFQEVKSLQYLQYADTGWGMNLRMHVLAVAVSMARFKRRTELIEMRHERYNRLSKGLHGHPFLRPPVTRDQCFRGQWQGYCVSVDPNATELRTEAIAEALTDDGLQVVSGGYQSPLHTRAAFRTKRNFIDPTSPANKGWRSYLQGDLPVSEQFYAQSIGFPLFLDEPLELVDKYLEACWRIANPRMSALANQVR